MKSTGIVRPLDSLGRIVLPIELRRTMGLACKDALEIFVENDSIILKKYLPNCIFCGSTSSPGCLSRYFFRAQSASAPWRRKTSPLPRGSKMESVPR